jgi:hydrogenase maturation factor HypE
MIISGTVTVAANSTSTNQVAGSIFEFSPKRGIVTLYASAAATGVNGTLLVGGQAVLNNNLVGFSNRFPIIPDDRLARSGILKGDRIFLTFTNTTGAGIVTNWLIEIT